MMDSTFTINGRIWLERDGQKLLGRGRVELLERIRDSGSIRQAALQMAMSYKQAWDMINDMNARFDSALVTSRRGGKGGGNATVTEKGLAVIEQFHVLENKFKDFMADSFGSVEF
ncbi:MAG: LysR family transcriptional regulator [Bacteroidota bacterium]|nr:LysR family transcriptional regulator [Bacteroidota bacterium]